MAGFFMRRTQDPEVALDLVAETFAIVVEQHDRCRATGDEEVTAWSYGIARNLLNGWYRKGAVERRAAQRLGVERPDFTEGEYDRFVELGGLANARDQISSGLQTLSDEQRKAVELRVVGERSYEEVAQVLDVSQDVARARVSRGLKALANVLDQSALEEVTAHD